MFNIGDKVYIVNYYGLEGNNLGEGVIVKISSLDIVYYSVKIINSHIFEYGDYILTTDKEMELVDNNTSLDDWL